MFSFDFGVVSVMVHVAPLCVFVKYSVSSLLITSVQLRTSPMEKRQLRGIIPRMN